MMAVARDIDAFARLVEALRPWLHHVVFVGGWAHRLYRLHPLAHPVEYPPLATLDTDVAVPTAMPATEESIRGRLLAKDFNEKLSGEHRPPVTRYELGAEYGGFYAEFLTPLIGSEYKLDKTPDVTTHVAGVTAQKLRYLDVLFAAPWSVALGRENGFPFSRPTTVRLPNAASYLAQKMLVYSKRKPAERPKDVLYIHDTIEVFAGSLGEIRREWMDVVRTALPARARRSVEHAADTMFAEVTDAVRGAVREAASAGRTVSTQMVLEVCRAGLSAIFQ